MEERDESENPLTARIGGGMIDDCGHVTTWSVPVKPTLSDEEFSQKIAALWASLQEPDPS